MCNHIDFKNNEFWLVILKWIFVQTMPMDFLFNNADLCLKSNVCSNQCLKPPIVLRHFKCYDFILINFRFIQIPVSIFQIQNLVQSKRGQFVLDVTYFFLVFLFFCLKKKSINRSDKASNCRQLHFIFAQSSFNFTLYTFAFSLFHRNGSA